MTPTNATPTPRPPAGTPVRDGPSRRSRLWSSRLWFLAVVLGITTLFYSASSIHDTSRADAAVRVVSRSMAEHIVALASSRLEAVVLTTFAPVGAPAPAGTRPGSPADALSVLQRQQEEGLRCRCRPLLPVQAFFAFDPAAPLAVRALAAEGALSDEDRRVISEIAAADARRASDPAIPSVHLRTDRRIGERAVVTFVPRNAAGGIDVVYGLVGRSDAIFISLFHRGAVPSSEDVPTMGLAQLDEMSMQVTRADSSPIFGALRDEGRYRATIAPPGVLEGLRITVALKSDQIQESLRAIMPHARLFRLGVLVVATIVLIVMAYGSSRRELLLARARSDFIAGVSHELRMPLAQVLLASETLALERERDAGERVTLARSIVREARRLTALVDNVLFFSRSGAVGMRPHPQRVETGALLTDAVEGVELAVRDAEQTIEAGPGLDLAMLADRELMRQALVNLVDNALKYGPKGQTIRLSAERVGTRVRLYVDDQGSGIPVADRARLFDAYERLGRDQVSERTGTGLGLWVVREIARVSNGSVWLDDAPDGGTRAVLDVPAA